MYSRSQYIDNNVFTQDHKTWPWPCVWGAKKMAKPCGIKLARKSFFFFFIFHFFIKKYFQIFTFFVKISVRVILFIKKTFWHIWACRRMDWETVKYNTPSGHFFKKQIGQLKLMYLVHKTNYINFSWLIYLL